MNKKITDVVISPHGKNPIEIQNVVRSGITKTSRTYVVEYLDKGQFNRVFIPLEAVYVIEEFGEESKEQKEPKASLKDVVDDGNDDTAVTDDNDADDDYEDLVEDDENENDDDDEDRDAEDDTDDDEDGKEYDEEIEKIRKKRANK